jgi:ferredoxin-NADP reductase
MRQGDSGFKQTMYALKAGDTISATGPIGHFTLSHAVDGLPIVFLVGGIGVTPMYSILKQAEHDGDTRTFIALYSNRFKKDATFHEEFRAMKVADFRYIPTLSQETTPAGADEERGYINEAMIRKYVADIQSVWFYIVGGPAFIEAMEKMLSDMGIAKERQVCDPFAGLTGATKK